MRFISKYETYVVCIRDEEIAYRMMPGGVVVQDLIKPLFVIYFQNDIMLPAYERLYAMQVFLTGDSRPFGAMPELMSQPIFNAAGRIIDSTAEYRPDFHFSLFDTETMIDNDEDREYAEQKLLAAGTLNIDYILVEKMKVPPPWPTYDDNDLVTAVNMMKHGGYDLLKVLEYEDAHEHREDWLMEIGKLLADQSIKDSADESLTMVIE